MKQEGKEHYAYLRRFGSRDDFLRILTIFFCDSDFVVCEGWFWTFAAYQPSQITTSQARL
jgi:hypothetical protein